MCSWELPQACLLWAHWVAQESRWVKPLLVGGPHSFFAKRHTPKMFNTGIFLDQKMNYLGIQSAPSLLPCKEQLSFRSFCVVKSTWCWAGSPCTRSPVVLKALSACLCLWKFGSICLLAVSLRTRLFFCADDFNHSILYSFSQLKHEAGANTVFSLQSVQPWLSVVFFCSNSS